MPNLPEGIDELVSLALKEDLGKGDMTTLACVDALHKGTGTLIAKEHGILCGAEIAKRVFQLVDEHTQVTLRKREGRQLAKGDIIGVVKGRLHSLLAAERTALNFLQRMSGIASLTNAYVQCVKSTRTTILDTRKTAPMLRTLDKYAVRTGGGKNLRRGLDDMILIKNNHIAAAGGVSQAVKRCIEFRKKNAGTKLAIEIEVATLDQLKEILPIRGIHRIMLDNFSLPNIRKAVTITAHRVPLEVSGGVTLANVQAIAKTGVEYISVGALTHSPRALDISFTIQ